MPLLAQNIVIDVVKWENDNMVKNALLSRLFGVNNGRVNIGDIQLLLFVLVKHPIVTLVSFSSNTIR